MTTSRLPAPTITPSASLHGLRAKLLALTAGAVLLVAGLPASLAAAAEPAAGPAPAEAPALRRTVQYEEAMAHAGDKTTFVAGDRVTVPFKPRKVSLPVLPSSATVEEV